MMEEISVYYKPYQEAFFLGKDMIGLQQSYVPFKSENIPDCLYFYCGVCGEVWGKRIPLASETSHHYYHRRPCFKHGGSNDMLLPFEWGRLDLISENVMAGLILAFPEEELKNG